ncbi:MAG: hypothetical protein U9R11_04460 [Chloroflexota bacterium]|nr:hypothetical protein [Chloroflexota bacterium]
MAEKNSRLLKIGLSIAAGLLSLVLLMTVLAAAGSAGAQGKEVQKPPIRAAERLVPSANRQQKGIPHSTISATNVTVSGPAEINNCDVVTFTIIATNDSVTATNVIITSTMPTGFTPPQRVFNVGTVAPNEVITRHAVFTAGCDAVSGQNVVTLTQEGGPIVVKRANFKVNPGAITLRKKPSVVPAALGDVVTWTVYVENTGYGVVSNVRVTDTLGSGLQYVSGLTSTSWVTIPIETAYSRTVSARVVACSGLDNVARATWGCDGVTCGTPHTATTSVDLQIRTPDLEYTPPDISIDYCTGYGTYTMTIINNGDGTAYTVTIAVDFSPLTITSSSAPYSDGAFHLTDVITAAGGSYPLTFTLHLPELPCDVARSGGLLYQPEYYDECGNPFKSPVKPGSWAIVGDVPSLSVSKIGPSGDEVYADEIITYTLNVTATNFPVGTTIYITDTLQPGCTTYSLLNDGGGSVISDGMNITITWSTTITDWSTDISFQPDATCCPTMCNCCGELATNNLEATATDCQTCTVTASDSEVTAIQCEEGILDSHVKQVSPISAEACTTRTYTTTYTFTDVFTNTPTWQGMVFTDTLDHQSYVADSAGIIVSNAVTCTATFSETLADGKLVISNISPTCGITVPGATMVITYQATVNDYTHCVDDRFYDWSYLNIGVTGNSPVCPDNPQCDDGIFEEGIWVGVAEPDMSVSISGVPGTVGPCGIYTPTVTASRLGDTPAYDARLTFPITDYAVIEVLGFGGATPVFTHTDAISYTWFYSDSFTSATTATVRLRVQRRCTAGPIRATVGYDNLCKNDESYDDTCTATDSKDPMALLPDFVLYKMPEVIHATGDVVTWTLTAINSGAGPAYSITLTDSLGSDLRYWSSTITSTKGSAAGVTPITSTHLVTWTELTILPAERYTIKLAAEIAGCDPVNAFYLAQGCQDETCKGVGPIESPVRLPETKMVNTNEFDTPIPMCFTGTITATVRNAGLLSVYSATITETLPKGLQYVSGSTEYVTGTGTTPPASGWVSGGEPSGVPDGPLAWTSDEITPLIRIYPDQPYQTVWVRHDVYANCGFAGDQLTIQAGYQDVCGNPLTTPASKYSMDADRPNVSLTKRGRNLTTSSVWRNMVYAEPGDKVQWRVRLQNTSDISALLTVVTDTLPSNTNNMTNVSISPTPDYTDISGVITWNVGTLGKTTWTAFITATVDSGECTAMDTRDVVTATWGCPETGCREQATDDADLRTRPVFPENKITVAPTTLHLCGGVITVTLVNDGPPAYNVILTDTLPSGFFYSETVSASTPPSTYPTAGDNPAVWTWADTNTLPTGVTTLTFSVRNATSGDCIEPSGPNRVDLLYDDHSSCTTGPYIASDTTTMDFLTPTLSVSKMPETLIGEVGDVVTWTITVSNTGSGDAPSVTVTDTADSGFSNLDATDGSDADETNTPVIVGNVIVWKPPVTITVGDSWAATVTVTVAASGVRTDTVEARGICAVGCTYSAGGGAHAKLRRMEIVKKVSPKRAGAGSTVTFDMLIKNTGDVTLDPVVVSDTLDVGLEYADNATVGGVPKEPDVQAGQTFTWTNVGPLSATKNITITFQAKVVAGDFNVLTNTANVRGTDPEGGKTADSDTAEVLSPIPVGGYIVPVSKVELLAPWMGLAALIAMAVAAAVIIRRRII